MFVIAVESAMQLLKNDNIINKSLKLQINSLSKKLIMLIIFI